MDFTFPDETNVDLENASFPSQLEDSSPPHHGDSRPPVPFSPPAVRSPGRVRTMKEFEDELISLRSENYNLKVRIYFMQQHRLDQNLPKDVEELQNLYTDLKVKYEQQKKDLDTKEDLLVNTYRALEVQMQQLESLKSEHESERQEFLQKIEGLEKELKEYHVKFMETSLQLDDTNALYCMTFGVNPKEKSKKETESSEEKIKELESALDKEKERVLMLEQVISGLNEKRDKESFQKLQGKLSAMEQKILNMLKEKELSEKTNKEIRHAQMKLEQLLHTKDQALLQKECELEHVKSLVNSIDKEMSVLKCRLHEKEELYARSESNQMDLKRLQNEYLEEISNLKQEINRLQRQSENRSPLKPLRERSASRKSVEQEETKALQSKIQVLQNEIKSLKDKPKKFEAVMQIAIAENKSLRRDLEQLKSELRNPDTRKGEDNDYVQKLIKEMTSEKDPLIAALKGKIEELTKTVNEKECKLQEYKSKLDALLGFNDNRSVDKSSLSSKEESSMKDDNEKEALIKELNDSKKEVEVLKRELRKKTFNLQGLVNTELWDKNREIEKLNKVCERKHLEVLGLQKELREYQLNVVKNVSNFMSPMGCQRSLFTENKENLHPVPDTTAQLQILAEEKRELQHKVEELEARLLNTPERDTESSLVQTLRGERDQAERLRKEAVNACMLMMTRLQELADFLDSLLPYLCGKKRRVVQQAVERSRELSRSLSLAAEESSLHCSAWTDLQPSLYVPLLPDISTVDFWSGEESQEDELSGEEDNGGLNTNKQDTGVKQSLGESLRLKFGKSVSDLINFSNSKPSIDESALVHGNIADISEGSLVNTSSDHGETVTKHSAEVKSTNIGKITLTSRKKSNTPNLTVIIDGSARPNEKGEYVSEYETWSEPDRDVSYARMGIKEESINKINNITSETDNNCPSPKSLGSRRASEIQKLHRKVQNLEQMNEALRSELVILHQLTPPAETRQDKATSIEMSRQSPFSIPSHLLEEIKNQREKLEASLFHNDYIRRQLESTVSTLRRSQVDESDKTTQIKLKELTVQLKSAECEISELKKEKENWNNTLETLQASLKQTSNELIDKQCAFLELQNSSSQNLKELEEKYTKLNLEADEKYSELEQKLLEIQTEKEELLKMIGECNKQIGKLNADNEAYQLEGKKNKQLQEDLNHQLQLAYRQKDELQKLVAEQEQLLADAERERGELATQLIARDRQVSDLQKRLTHLEMTGNELESALRSQLDVATHQCAQFETKLRELDNANQQIAQVERIKSELERRVAELEMVNTELESKLSSLNVMKQPYSDCETDGGSSVVGSPRRSGLPPLLPSSPSHTHRSQDLTSDYVSDHDIGLSSPQAQPRGLWYPTSPHGQSQTSASPDLGIDSDPGRFSSLDIQSQPPKSTTVSLRGTPVCDLLKLEEENTQLRRNLLKTRRALEETLSQLTAANQHKRQYEAQLSAVNHTKAKVERAICRQLHKTHSILKKARVNLEDEPSSDQR